MTEKHQQEARELSGFTSPLRLTSQEGNSMPEKYDGFRAGMLRAAEMARGEFKRAPEAAKGHDCVYMSGYEDACDHLSAVIAQAAVIDSVRIAGAQPDWQYHIALLLPDGAVSDEVLLKIYQVVEHEIRRTAELSDLPPIKHWNAEHVAKIERNRGHNEPSITIDHERGYADGHHEATEYLRHFPSRDKEIHEVLQGLSFLAGRKVRCWCVIPTTVPERHSPACLAARSLWEKVQEKNV